MYRDGCIWPSLRLGSRVSTSFSILEKSLFLPTRLLTFVSLSQSSTPFTPPDNVGILIGEGGYQSLRLVRTRSVRDRLTHETMMNDPREDECYKCFVLTCVSSSGVAWSSFCWKWLWMLSLAAVLNLFTCSNYLAGNSLQQPQFRYW